MTSFCEFDNPGYPMPVLHMLLILWYIQVHCSLRPLSLFLSFLLPPFFSCIFSFFLFNLGGVLHPRFLWLPQLTDIPPVQWAQTCCSSQAFITVLVVQPPSNFLFVTAKYVLLETTEHHSYTLGQFVYCNTLLIVTPSYSIVFWSCTLHTPDCLLCMSMLSVNTSLCKRI